FLEPSIWLFRERLKEHLPTQIQRAGDNQTATPCPGPGILQRPEGQSERRDRKVDGQQRLGEAGGRLCRNWRLTWQGTQDQPTPPDKRAGQTKP
ncbi:hypothetical protein, partial [Gluconobacter oxydans]|uniref:hypothetical protein n=1 Tax=Gluconobacter oxydans TaxID=442 RepID=UPI000AB77B0C